MAVTSLSVMSPCLAALCQEALLLTKIGVLKVIHSLSMWPVGQMSNTETSPPVYIFETLQSATDFAVLEAPSSHF